MAGRVEPKSRRTRGAENVAAIKGAYREVADIGGEEPRPAGLKKLKARGRRHHGAVQALADPVTAAEITIFEDPKGAERSGLVSQLIASGNHRPMGLNGMDSSESIQTEPLFEKPAGHRPTKKYRSGRPTDQAIEGAAGYVIPKGSVATVKEIINGAGILGEFNDKGQTYIAFSKSLFPDKIADLNKLGARILNSDMRPVRPGSSSGR